MHAQICRPKHDPDRQLELAGIMSGQHERCHLCINDMASKVVVIHHTSGCSEGIGSSKFRSSSAPEG